MMQLADNFRTFISRVRLKLIYLSAQKMGLEFIYGHLVKVSAINQQSLVVDLGANLGAFSYEARNRFKCRILSVEANPELFKRLSFGTDIKFFNYAITDNDGEVDFVISENIEASSVFDSIASVWNSANTVSIKTRHLYSFLNEMGEKRVNLLKVDIEGSELLMIDSLSNAQIKAFDQISIEFHESLDTSLKDRTLAIINRIISNGFYIIVTSSDKFSDVLFINKGTIKFNTSQIVWYWIHRLLAYKG